MFLCRLGPHSAACALLRNPRTTECGAGKFLTHLAVRAAPFALLSQSPTLLSRSAAGKARVSLFFLHRAGGTRLCGLASVRLDPLWLALLELGLLLPLVHLGHGIARPGMQLTEGRDSLLKGK
jgi:hypothetical protein